MNLAYPASEKMIFKRIIFYFFICTIYFSFFCLAEGLYLRNLLDGGLFIILIITQHYFYIFGVWHLNFSEIADDLENQEDMSDLNDHDRAVYSEIKKAFKNLDKAQGIYEIIERRAAIKSLFRANPTVFTKYNELNEVPEFLKI